MLFYSLYALTGFLVGVYVLYNMETAYLLLSLFFFLGIVLFMCIIKRLREFVFSVLVFALFCGLGLYSIKSASLASCYTEEYVTVTGRISEIPYKNENGVWCYTLNCNKLRYIDEEDEFKNRILVYSENEYSLDDTIKVSGFLKLFENEKNPGCFNAYTYYKSIGIDYKISSLEDGFSSDKIKSNSIYSQMMRMRNKICTVIDKTFSPDNAIILKYILVNFKKEMDLDFTNSLLNTGVLRCLYSPYFHLVLILSVLGIVLGGCPIGVRRIITVLCLMLYLCINPYILTARKLFSFTIICELLYLNKKAFKKEDVLWLTIILSGIQNPYVLYNEGFLMSCAATFFIIVFFRKIYQKVSWINKHKGILNILVMYFVSMVLLMPIAAFLFEGISVYSIFVSVILLPIICVIYLISPFMLGGMGLFEMITDNLITFIRNIPQILERLPLSYISLPRPPFVLVLAILFVFAAVYNRKYKKKFSLLLSIAIGLCLSFTMGEFLRAGKMTVTFLNISQGDCTVLDIPYKCTVMVDSGGSVDEKTEYDVGKRDIFPYLRYENIKTIDYMFLSHYHKDHADGIVSLLDLVKIKNIFLPDCLKDNEYRVIIEKRAKELGIKLHYIKGPQKIKLEDGVEAEILYFDKEADDDNDKSVVMRLIYDDVSSLFTGDITKNTEEKILEAGIDVSADILKVAHHSSYQSNSLEFLKAVRPEFAVAMFGEANPYGFPSYETKERLKTLNIPFITTAQEGCIQIKENFGRLIWQKKTR